MVQREQWVASDTYHRPSEATGKYIVYRPIAADIITIEYMRMKTATILTYQEMVASVAISANLNRWLSCL